MVRSSSNIIRVAVVTSMAALAIWLGGREIVRQADARDLPVLPDVSPMSAPIAQQIQELDAAARKTPWSADAVGALAMAYHGNLFPTEAEQAYAQAARRAPADWRWPYYLALTAEDRGNTTQVVTWLNAALAIDPNLPLAWFRLGEAEFKRGRFDEAGAAYTRALSATAAPGGTRSPVSAYAATGLARVALQKGQTTEARSILEKVLAGDARRFGSAFRLLGEAASRLNDPEAAVRALAAANRLPAYVPPLDPQVDAVGHVSRNSAWLLKFAALAARTRDLAAREFYTRRAKEFDPDNPAVVFEMATLLQAMGRHEEALAEYRRHQVLAPGEIQTEVQIGRCLADLDRLKEAEALLRRVVARGGAVAEFNLGEVLDRQERLDEARLHYERALALNPFHARSLNNLGILAARGGHLDEALRRFEQAANAAPEDADVQNNLGAAELQFGQIGKAQEAFERALELNPGHQDARKNLERIRGARRPQR